MDARAGLKGLKHHQHTDDTLICDTITHFLLISRLTDAAACSTSLRRCLMWTPNLTFPKQEYFSTLIRIGYIICRAQFKKEEKCHWGKNIKVFPFFYTCIHLWPFQICYLMPWSFKHRKTIMGESRASRGRGDDSCKIYRPCQSWGQDSQARDGPLPFPRVLHPPLGHATYPDVRWPGAAMG